MRGNWRRTSTGRPKRTANCAHLQAQNSRNRCVLLLVWASMIFSTAPCMPHRNCSSLAEQLTLATICSTLPLTLELLEKPPVTSLEAIVEPTGLCCFCFILFYSISIFGGGGGRARLTCAVSLTLPNALLGCSAQQSG